MKRKLVYFITLIIFLTGCKKDFLDKKPSSSILTPSTLSDLNGLLELVSLNSTGAIAQMSADEYLIVSNQDYLGLRSATQRNAYIWAPDIYEGEAQKDWETPYSQIFCTNNVLQILNQKKFSNKKESDHTRGWACFNRAYAYFDLAKNFCKVYRKEDATTDLGVPIRLDPSVDVTEQRSTLEVTFAQILSDLLEAARLLEPQVPAINKNRPSKAAAYAMLARVFLYQGNYKDAELYADSCLLIHSELIDYNQVSKTSLTPFSYTAPEIIYYSAQVNSHSGLTAYGNTPAIQVNPEFYSMYGPGDLRKEIFFTKNNINNFNVKRGYTGASYPFTGLATDEILLIKAECLVRRGQISPALEKLNQLLIKRFQTNQFIPLNVNSGAEALAMILTERKKELIWRGLRWYDLKRFNRDGANISLRRNINNTNYILPPNDNRWIFPIPDQEILSSGITQNQR